MDLGGFRSKNISIYLPESLFVACHMVAFLIDRVLGVMIGSIQIGTFLTRITYGSGKSKPVKINKTGR